MVGTKSGRLLLFHNLGPPIDPRWKLADEAFANYHHGRNPAPVFADVDGDGDLDLAVGNENGRVFYWENTGTAKKPAFTHRPEILREVRVGKNAVPVFADLDGDSRPDLLVGNLRGWLALYVQGQALAFLPVTRRYLGFDVGINSSPHVGDLTASGLPALLVGSDRGPIAALLATGTSTMTSSGWKRNSAYFEGLSLPLGSHPALADLDRDGDPDLFVGSESGRIFFYRNHVRIPELAEAVPDRER